MVLDAAFYTSAIVSLMMDGVCCAWQMNVEEERKEIIRHEIMLQYEREKQEEIKLWEQMHGFNLESDCALAAYGTRSDAKRQKLPAHDDTMALSTHLPPTSSVVSSSALIPPSEVETRCHPLRFTVLPKTSAACTAVKIRKLRVTPYSPSLEPSLCEEEQDTYHRKINNSIEEIPSTLMDEDEEKDFSLEEVTSLVDIALD